MKQKGLIKRLAILIIMIGQIILLLLSGYKIWNISEDYFKGTQEYEEIRKAVINVDETDEESFSVDFDKLHILNKEVIGWIRFEEPSIISYPIVQGKDNTEYLYQTFEGYENTVGCIFVNALNSPDFTDPCTIIFGHRMNNGTMFNKLGKYQEKEFWERYPYFYIYTPDNTEITYQVYSVGIIKETSRLYSDYMVEGDRFEEYIEESRECGLYETNVDVNKENTIVMLSTCTNVNDEERLVVFGLKIREVDK